MSNIPFNNKQQPLQTAIENDQNVSSELKYCPQFPERFGCIEDSRTFGSVEKFRCGAETYR